MIAAAQRGVTTKIIFDSVEVFLRTNGQWNFFPLGRASEVTHERRATREMLRRMEEAGVDFFKYGWRYFMNRNHSKTLFVDNELLFIGGFNPTEHNTLWHEVCAVTSGPIVTDGLRQFNEIFSWSGKSSAPENGSGVAGSFGIEAMAGLVTNVPRKGRFHLTHFLFEAIGAARKSIRIENGYVGDRQIFEKLIDAKKRGVETVQIVAPARSNHPSVDRILAEMGPSSGSGRRGNLPFPHMMHAKVMVVDDLLVTVGSSQPRAILAPGQ